jgi:ankyrin repeat protein
MRAWRRARLRKVHELHEQEVNQLLHASPHQAINRHKDDYQIIRDRVRCAEILLYAIRYEDMALMKAMLRLHPGIGLGVTFDANFGAAFDLSVDAGWDGRVSLIHVACVVSLPIVKALVEHDPSWKDMESEHSIRPLHVAVARGDYQLLSYLIDMAANPSLSNASAETPLLLAVKRADMRGVRLLLYSHEKGECSCGSRASSCISTLGTALACGHYEIAKVLLENSRTCARESFKRMARHVAGYGGGCVDEHAAAVCYGAWGPNAPERRFLEEKGDAFNVLMWGCAWGKPLAVEAALQKWGRALLTTKFKDDLGRQPLHVACLYGQLDMVRRLARYKELRVNDVEEEVAGARRTALMMAAAEGHLDIVNFLVEHMKAKVSLKDAMGQTALDHARECGKEDVVEYFSRPATSNKVRRPVRWEQAIAFGIYVRLDLSYC